jgi:hypothetical protein
MRPVRPLRTGDYLTKREPEPEIAEDCQPPRARGEEGAGRRSASLRQSSLLLG